MQYDKNNSFARIIRGEIPCKKIYEDKFVLAIEDIQPVAPVHILVMPKGEYVSFDDFCALTDASTTAHFFRIITIVAKKLNIQESGYRLITNHGADASQSVPHFHVHLMGGRTLGALLPGDMEAR